MWQKQITVSNKHPQVDFNRVFEGLVEYVKVGNKAVFFDYFRDLGFDEPSQFQLSYIQFEEKFQNDFRLIKGFFSGVGSGYQVEVRDKKAGEKVEYNHLGVMKELLFIFINKFTGINPWKEELNPNIEIGAGN